MNYYDLIPLVIMCRKLQVKRDGKLKNEENLFVFASWFTSPSSSSMIFFRTFLIDDLLTNLVFYSVSFSLIYVYTN